MPTRTATLLTSTKTGALMARRWRFEVTQGPDVGLSYEQTNGTVLIGTHEDTDIALGDNSVSRYHAEVRLYAEGVDILDLGSKNGVRVGDARVERTFIATGGRIRLGHTTIHIRALDEELDVPDVELFGDFITSSQHLQRLLGELALVAATEATVVIEGPTGVGKELLARAVHDRSRRATGPYVVVDCAGVQANLVESQLFGHQAGAFTGATNERTGAFERANGGTIFLDEISELSVDLQPRLLRVLEARTVQRVGGDEHRPVDVRIVAATNRSLAAMVEDRLFRADLYHRLAVIRTRVPPLCERPEDILLLAERLAMAQDPDATISPAVRALLVAYDWPGNVRELRNVIERAALLARGHALQPEHLFPDEAPMERYDEALERFEKRYVEALLARHDGVISRAANAAGLSRGGLYKVMKRAKARRAE